jgi:hypothetical protein
MSKASSDTNPYKATLGNVCSTDRERSRFQNLARACTIVSALCLAICLLCFGIALNVGVFDYAPKVVGFDIYRSMQLTYSISLVIGSANTGFTLFWRKHSHVGINVIFAILYAVLWWHSSEAFANMAGRLLLPGN